MIGIRLRIGMPETVVLSCCPASPPITVVWPSFRNTCVVASRWLMIGALNCISFVALLLVWSTARFT